VRSLVPIEVVVVDHAHDEGFLTDESMYDAANCRPSFSMSTTATVFFGRTKQWLQRRFDSGHLELDAEPIEVWESESGVQYRWRLCDVEQMAHALAQNGYITAAQLVRTLDLIKLVAQNFGYLPSDIATEVHPYDPNEDKGALAAVEQELRFVDDLDGSPGARPRTFALGSAEYHLDLTEEHWAKFLETLEPYIQVATMTPRRDRQQLQDVRAWARANGYEVGERGRLPMPIMRAYHRSLST
jgi:hypothetical protein